MSIFNFLNFDSMPDEDISFDDMEAGIDYQIKQLDSEQANHRATLDAIANDWEYEDNPYYTNY